MMSNATPYSLSLFLLVPVGRSCHGVRHHVRVPRHYVSNPHEHMAHSLSSGTSSPWPASSVFFHARKLTQRPSTPSCPTTCTPGVMPKKSKGGGYPPSTRKEALERGIGFAACPGRHRYCWRTCSRSIGALRLAFYALWQPILYRPSFCLDVHIGSCIACTGSKYMIVPPYAALGSPRQSSYS